MNQSCVYLLVLACFCFLFSWSILALVFLTFSISLFLFQSGWIFIPYLFLSTLIGLCVVFLLFNYADGTKKALSLDYLEGFLLLGVFFWYSQSVSSSGGLFLPSCKVHLELMHFSFFLDSCLLLSWLAFVIFFALWILLRIALPALHFGLEKDMAFCKWGFVGFLLADFFLLFLIGAALCFLPALIRFAFDAISGQIEGKKPFSVREMPQRWTCDVYEVGISTPGTSSPSFLFDKSSPSEGACFRFLAYVFLFLLLDLEASLFLPLLLSNGHVFLLLGFFAFLLLSFGLAFTTLHF